MIRTRGCGSLSGIRVVSLIQTGIVVDGGFNEKKNEKNG